MQRTVQRIASPLRWTTGLTISLLSTGWFVLMTNVLTLTAAVIRRKRTRNCEEAMNPSNASRLVVKPRDLPQFESRGKDGESEQPVASESSTPMKERELEKQGTEEERDLVANIEDDANDMVLRMAALEAENAELKSLIYDLQYAPFTKRERNKVFRNMEKKTVREGNKDDMNLNEDFDPLGATNNNEAQQLKIDLTQLTMQYEEVKKLNLQLENERVDMESFTELLKEKEERLQAMEQANEDLELQLRSVKEEFQRFRKQSESNAEDYEHRVESLSEQLHQQLKSKQGHHRSMLDSFPENCDHPFPIQSIHVNDDTHSTDVECSVGHDSNGDEMEEYHKKIYQLTQSLRSMGMKQKDLQRRLAEAQDERDYLKSVMEDLQQQVDASSPETSARLRAIVQSLETEMARLERENETLKFKSRQRHATEGEEDSETGGFLLQQSFSDIRGQSVGMKTEEGISELSEELVDCSMDIMGELANATSDREIGISMTCVQYAGLLSAVQKAIKHFEQSKQSFESTESLRVLDSSLSQSLSISRFRVRAPGSAGEKRLDELLMIVKEKESELKFMVNMITDLRQEIKGRQSLTLQQEVQLEYLKQQLSSSDKVISLTWEVEGLKKIMEESQRELKAQKDLNDQQQQELTIQWQSKQQAVAETLSQNHRVSSFSRQLEHVVEANEALEAEKLDLEEALEEAYDEKEKLETDLVKERQRHGNGVKVDELRDLLGVLHEVDASLKAFETHWSDGFADKKRALIQTVKGIDRDCSTWKTEVYQLLEERDALQKALDIQTEARLKAESLRERAEQEKIGVQDILSLTSETTSTEIIGLQKHLSEMTHQLEKERTASHESKEKISELQASIIKLESSSKDEKQKWQQEVHSLKDKLTISDQERSNLEGRMRSYKDVISGLNRDLTAYDGRVKELNNTIEQTASSLRLEAEKTETLTQKLAENTEQLHDAQKLNADLQEQCLQLEGLRAEMEQCVASKKDVEIQLERVRCDYGDIQTKYNQAIERMNNLELKNSELSQAHLGLQDKLAHEQQALLDAHSEWEAEIASLSEMEIPKDRWPSAVLALVQKWENRALESAGKEHDRKIKALNAELDEVKNREQEQIASYEEELVECGDDLRSLQDTIDKLQREMKERESNRQSEIGGTKEQMQQTVQRLETELLEMTQRHDILESESTEIIEQLKEQSHQKDIQLADVQAKARELMKEKDEEIKQLKASPVTDIHHRSLSDNIHNDLLPSNVHHLQAEVNSLKHQVARLMDSLADSERTHDLQTEAHQVLKDELIAYKRSERRAGLDMDYVKNVLVSAFETGSLPKSSPMLVVLARLFEFDEEEMERVYKKAESPSEQRRLTSTSSGSMFSPWKRT